MRDRFPRILIAGSGAFIMVPTGLRRANTIAQILLLFGLLFAWMGCAGPETIVLPVVSKDVYRSKERILHRIKPGDTPQSLAQKYYGETKHAWMIEDTNPDKSWQPGQFAVVPFKIPNRAGINGRGYQTVPILCYHRFAKACDSPVCMPEAIFERQMRYLNKNGYRVIGPEELLEFLNHRQAIPQKAVMITVDDGYRSVYHVAYPILKKYGFTATLFIYTDYVGVSPKALTWDLLRKLKREGYYIGSHSVMHSDLSRKKNGENRKAYLARLKKEIFRSKQIIDRQLNQDTLIFSYPYGRRNETVISFSQEAGYKIGVTVDRGGNPFFADQFLIKRDQVLKRDMGRFISRLKTFQHYPLQ
jgi:peptidoglycan/xylan/chitin deacetylase (PgdA/CDA1 family)